MDWEAWLRSAAKRPSDHEDSKRDRTEKQIKDALSSYGPLQGRPYRVYAKGSYANNTNVRLNYDVDIAVEYYGFFYSDLALDLKGHDKSEVGLIDSTDPYTTDEFKSDILSALKAAYGASSIEEGNIAYRVRDEEMTLPADVVPSWEYRRYDRIDANGNPVYYQGSRVYPRKGMHINNYPNIQLEDGTAKNLATSRRYKRMVRCLKKMQTYALDNGYLSSELPSYLLECLVFNVPNSYFGHDSYTEEMKAVLTCVWSETKPEGNWNSWVEVHGLKFLFRGNRKWDRETVHSHALTLFGLLP